MTRKNGIDAYEKILAKMMEYPSGIPMKDGKVSPAFEEYIKLLFTPEEAEVAQHLELMPLQAGEIAQRAGKSEEETQEVLDRMTDSGAIHDIGGYSFFLAMPHLMNTGFKYKNAFKKLGRKGAELYQEFFIGDKFYKRYESSDAGTPQTRIIPMGKSIKRDNEIVNTEEIHNLIDDAMEPIVITDCPCRGRTEFLGERECEGKYPVKESCFQLGFFGEYFLRRGEGRKLSRDEAHRLADEYAELGLIFTTDNSQSPNHQVLCCCCGCCCSLLRGMTRFEDKNENCTSKANYISSVDRDLCIGCGVCVDRCVFDAVQLENEKASVAHEKCFGCGVCAVTCPAEAMKLVRQERSRIYDNPMALGSRIYTENRDK